MLNFFVVFFCVTLSFCSEELKDEYVFLEKTTVRARVKSGEFQIIDKEQSSSQSTAFEECIDQKSDSGTEFDIIEEQSLKKNYRYLNNIEKKIQKLSRLQTLDHRQKKEFKRLKKELAPTQ